MDRYGNDILGLYLDEGSGAADSYKVVDYPRLRKTITGKHPHLVMMQNDYGNLYSGDVGNKEVFLQPHVRHARRRPVAIV